MKYRVKVAEKRKHPKNKLPEKINQTEKNPFKN